MRKAEKGKRVRAVPVWMGILVFLLAFGAGAVSRIALKPAWAGEYAIRWSGALGTLKTDLPYGEGEANRFDLYLPADGGRERYGLVVYLHAGGFTTGNKADDREMLAWLCAKGYVAAGINYTLRDEAHPEASVLSQSNEIRAAVPQVVAAAEEAGYHIDKMAAAGYVTAWFMWQLRGDRSAAEAFVGEAPEILDNPMYREAAVDLQ